ncbi:SGNH/GDSL hydrolase family protein [Prauserella cavernicola]|uniref:Lipase n=1 Tax=Prauserella cavernicola TaxID=2800127 RepID=A0A934V884_9PSEU|nr:SGNH/GDSL hydrolase family protein [Prauserella cavernicola]MBK1789387.1 lipase [Prauserella cavernicola]
MSTAARPLSTPITPDLVRGAPELEATPVGVRAHRLPAWAVAQAADPRLAMAESQPSGVRLRFATDATALELRAHATRFRYRGAPPRPFGVFDLVVDGRLTGQASVDTATVVNIDMATGAREITHADAGGVLFDPLPAGTKRVEIWLPHNETIELLELRSDAPVVPLEEDRPVWLHHGSSISQGSNALHPTGIWPVVAATHGGVDLLNLGFGGSALLDPFVARTIRDTPAQVISLKLGINVVNADLMRKRAFGSAVHGFLDTIRDGHPQTPLLVVSPILCPIHEHTPGPGAFDLDALARGELRFRATGDPEGVDQGQLTLTVVREELARIVAERSAEDRFLSYLDGRELYGAADAEELPLPDDLHPGAEAHLRIGRRFADIAFGAGASLVARPEADTEWPAPPEVTRAVS